MNITIDLYDIGFMTLIVLGAVILYFTIVLLRRMIHSVTEVNRLLVKYENELDRVMTSVPQILEDAAEVTGTVTDTIEYAKGTVGAVGDTLVKTSKTLVKDEETANKALKFLSKILSGVGSFLSGTVGKDDTEETC